MSEWSQEAVALELAVLCKGSGISKFEPEAVKKVWFHLADKERNLPEHLRIGFWYCSEYGEGAKTKFLNQVKTTWNNTPKPIMSELIMDNPPNTSHKYLCVLSVKLDRDDYEPTAVHRALRDYLIQAIPTPFAVLVSKCCKNFGCWYDLEVKFSTDIVLTFQALSKVPWIKTVQSRPVSKFGVHSPELI